MRKRWVTKTKFCTLEKISYEYFLRQIKRKGANLTHNSEGRIEYHETKAWWEANIDKKFAPKKYQEHTHSKDIKETLRFPAVPSSYSRNGQIPPTGDSIARKEAAMARIKELEAQEKEGKLIDKAQAMKAIFLCGRQVRDLFMAIPKRVSGTLAVETDQPTIQAVLEGEIEKGLKVFEDVKI